MSQEKKIKALSTEVDQNTELLVWPDSTQSFTEYYLNTHLNIRSHFMKSTFEVMLTWYHWSLKPDLKKKKKKTWFELSTVQYIQKISVVVSSVVPRGCGFLSSIKHWFFFFLMAWKQKAKNKRMSFCMS